MTIETMPRLAPETVTPIKPSEALRLGRLTRPRRFEGEYFDGELGACAIGAMVIGYGYDPDNGLAIHALEKVIREVENRPCPVCGQNWTPVSHLNDDHHWSDDQIVTWLESLGL